MVVLEVKIEHVAIAEDKREPPVAVDPDARQIQILDQGSGVQGRQLQPQLAGKGWLNASRAACLEEQSQSSQRSAMRNGLHLELVGFWLLASCKHLPTGPCRPAVTAGVNRAGVSGLSCLGWVKIHEIGIGAVLVVAGV